MSEKKLKRWTKEELSVLLRLYPDHTNAEIARTIGRSEGSVCYMAHIKGLRKHKEWKLMKSSLTCFKKGHVPQNKGKTWDEYMGKEQQEMARKTCYRKGHRPDNLKPVGYERKTVDGYWEVKVAMPNVFKAKHRILWEQHHGPIPEGMCITFIDGNPDNIVIENLRAEGMKEKFERCCCIHTVLPPDIRSMVIMKGHLKRQINKIENNGKKRKHRKT